AQAQAQTQAPKAQAQEAAKAAQQAAQSPAARAGSDDCGMACDQPPVGAQRAANFGRSGETAEARAAQLATLRRDGRRKQSMARVAITVISGRHKKSGREPTRKGPGSISSTPRMPRKRTGQAMRKNRNPGAVATAAGARARKTSSATNRRTLAPPQAPSVPVYVLRLQSPRGDDIRRIRLLLKLLLR